MTLEPVVLDVTDFGAVGDGVANDGPAVLAHACDAPQLIPAMGRNVLICLLTPVLMAIGLLLS